MFCHGSNSHMIRMLPLVEGFSSRGYTVYLFGAIKFRDAVELRGGRFIDLYSRHSLSRIDPASRPRLIKHLTFSVEQGEKIAGEVAELNPSLIVYSSFSVIGALVGKLLNLPYICVCPGVFDTPDLVSEKFSCVPGFNISEKCHAAVKKLQSLGFHEATPFYGAHSRSPYLNIWSELPEFTPQRIHEFIDPALYTIALDPPEGMASSKSLFPTNETLTKIYVAFGKNIWWGCEQAAFNALSSIADIFGNMDTVQVVISLGGWEPLATRKSELIRSNVRVEFIVDQWSALQEADIFLTHHGLNSTHEAIYCRVPMLSYPIAFDQPFRAGRCQEFGIALPIAKSTMGPPDSKMLLAGLDKLVHNRLEFDARLNTIRATQVKLLSENSRVTEMILEHVGL
jgi:UDP:flavonoid glycosyltransferase YjiC (YdhE family)